MATRGRILSGFYRVLGGGGVVWWLFKLVKKHFFFYLLARRGSVNWRPWTDWSPRDRVTALQLVGWRETRQVNPSRSSCTGLGSVPVPIRLDLTAGLTDFFWRRPFDPHRSAFIRKGDWISPEHKMRGKKRCGSLFDRFLQDVGDEKRNITKRIVGVENAFAMKFSLQFGLAKISSEL